MQYATIERRARWFGAEPQTQGTGKMELTAFGGPDVHKRRSSVAIAEAGRDGEVRICGGIPGTSETLQRVVEKLERPGRRLHFCDKAGRCGYGVHWLLRGLGHDCIMVAPWLIPRWAGDRMKTNRRDGTAPAADVDMGARRCALGGTRSV